MKKKLTFSHFLIKRLISWLVGLMAFATVMNVIYALVMEMSHIRDQEQAFLNAEININQIIAKGYDTPEKISYYLAREVNYRDESDTVAFAFADDEYNVVATSEWTAFLIHMREKNVVDADAVTDVYKCGSAEFIEQMEKYMGSAVFIEISEAYAKDGLFIPGKVTVFGGNSSEALEPFSEVIETADFTPANKEEYTYLPDDEFYWIEGGTRDKEVLNAAVDSADGAWREKGNTALWKYSIISTPEKNYKLYMVHCYDFWAEDGDLAIVTALGYVLCAVGISFATAYMSCNKYTKQYELDEYRRNMTNALAHDLKTPLTAIYGYAENLKDNVHSEKKDYYADAVIENVNYMNSIITSTLELAKLEEGNTKAKYENVNISALVQEIYKKHSTAAEERGLKFSISGKTSVSADKIMLSHAVENLISNAVKHSTDNSTVEIIWDSKCLTVVNSCDKDLKGNTDELCKPFVKADESRSSRSGSGIGLSIVKNIAALHGFGFEAKAENGRFTASIIFKKK